MEQRPDQPPEGRLIADAADHMNLSIREAARRAGISYGRWRQIVTGYQNVSPGSFAPVRAPAKTLAKMAAVVGVTPGQMETLGLRPDAAEFMRQEDERPVPPPRRGDAEWRGVGDPADLAPYIEDVRKEAYEVLVNLYGDNAPPRDDPRAEAAMSALPGAVVFPGDDDFARADAATWDKRALRLSEKVTVIALGHQLRDQADKRENRRTGLIAGYGSITAGIPSWNVLARRP